VIDTEPTVKEAARAQSKLRENFAQVGFDPRNFKPVANCNSGCPTNDKTEHSLQKPIIGVSQCEPSHALNRLSFWYSLLCANLDGLKVGATLRWLELELASSVSVGRKLLFYIWQPQITDENGCA
jgi:hypothetical protein